jgi:hypothetical protein
MDYQMGTASTAAFLAEFVDILYKAVFESLDGIE